MFQRKQNLDNLPFAALTVEEAGVFIKGIISDELRSVTSKEPEQPQPESINIDDAVTHLREHGYPISKNTIYNLVSKKSIPHRKVGRRVVFSRSELLRWLESKTEQEVSKSESVLLLAESARKRSRTNLSQVVKHSKAKESCQ